MSESDAFVLLPFLLVAHGVVGALDTLVNHEFVEGLRHRKAARSELVLHSVREAIYAMLFLGFAWFAWLGSFAWVIAVLLGAEVLVTLIDEAIENRTRVLPQNERVLHVLLTLNLGVLIALFAPLLLDWSEHETALAPAHHGWVSWALSVLGIASALWSIRDLLAVRALK